MYKTKGFTPRVGMIVAYTYTPSYRCPCCGQLVPGTKTTVKAKVTCVEIYNAHGTRGIEVTIHTGTQEVTLYNSDFYNRCTRVK